MTEPSSVARRLSAVNERIARACERAGRQPGDVKLLAVSKRHSVEAIRVAYAAGQREFGENYVSELRDKAAALGDLEDLTFRFIGQLQRNKAKYLAQVGCAVDTVDSLALAETLSQRAQASEHVLEVMLQVNLDEEPQKGGVAPDGVAELAAAVGRLPALELVGLMAIPRASPDPEQMRPAFRRLKQLAVEHALAQLSMGMSADLEVAIQEGATMVRIGTAVFGPRA